MSSSLQSVRKNNFDLIRLFAAIEVMFVHSIEHLKLGIPGHVVYGTFVMFPGVAVFFIVSGFLISGTYFNSGRPVWSYFISRALRIYPALWVNIIVLIAALLITSQVAAMPPPAGPIAWLLVACTTGSDWVADRVVGAALFQSGGFYPVFPSGVLWTIPVELTFLPTSSNNIF